MLRRSFIQSLKRVEDALSTVGLRSLSCCPRQVAGSQLHFNASSGSSVDSAAGILSERVSVPVTIRESQPSTSTFLDYLCTMRGTGPSSRLCGPMTGSMNNIAFEQESEVDCHTEEWRADSVRRKRKKKMNKHKHAKRRKLNRHRK